MTVETTPGMTECSCALWSSLAPCRPLLALGYTPNVMQRRLLHEIRPGGRFIYGGARQGAQKTEGASAALVSTGLTTPCDSAVVAPSERATEIVIERSKVMLRALDVEIVRQNLTLVEFRLPHWPTGKVSRVVGLPSNAANIRGMAVGGILLYEEAQGVSDEVRIATEPFVDEAGGAILMIGTASAPIGPLWEKWSDPGNGYVKLRTTLDDLVDSGFRTPEFREAKRREMTPTHFAQEYYFEFVSSSGALLSADEIYRAYDRGREIVSAFAGVL